MSAEIVEHWLASGRNAIINSISLKPIEHNLMEGKPLSSQKGQAEAFFLVDDQGNWWILKKFHGNFDLDPQYLRSVSTLLPNDEGFMCGTKRQILNAGTLWKTWGCYFNRDLSHWLDGTILMPRIDGVDWAGLADDIRDGSVKLDQNLRIALCRSLTELIELLEATQCCHRDLSCGNVFIELQQLRSYLIDFDSLYHPSLTMPRATTCGTTGYTPHHAWNGGQLDARQTWCEYADRYALALLNVEFMLVDSNSGVTGEGGLFDQDELRNQRGSGLSAILSRLKTTYPGAVQLLEATIHSSNLADCPSPADWNQFFNSVAGPTVKSPSLDALGIAKPNFLQNILRRLRPAAPLWPAPDLQQMPEKQLIIPKKPQIQLPKVDLPSDPWNQKT